MVKTYKPNTELKKIINDFKDDFTRTAESSKKEYLMTLPSGARIPNEMKIYNSEELSKFKERTAERKAKALSILDEHLTEVHEKMTAAPSPDAVATLSLLATRNNLTSGELDHLVKQYGDNYQSYRALQDIGAKNNMRIPDHNLTRQESDLNDLRSSIEKVMTYEKISSSSSLGVYAFIASTVDGVITD